MSDILNDTGKLIFFLLCFVMISQSILAFVFFNITKQFIHNSRPVKARINKLEIDRGGMIAHISLKDQLGKRVDTTVKTQLNKYKENEEIDVLSHKTMPEKVKINSFLPLWILPGALLQGVIMLGIALAIMTSMNITQFPF